MRGGHRLLSGAVLVAALVVAVLLVLHPWSRAVTAKAIHDDDAARKLAATPLTAADLLSAPVPALCGFPAGTLVDGQLPGQPASLGHPPSLVTQPLAPTSASRPRDLVSLGDLNGDGVGDAAAPVNCNAGGVGWPDYIVFWTRNAGGLKALGAYSMSTAVGDARNGTLKLSYSPGGTVTVDSIDYRTGDEGCCASGRARVTLKWNGAKVVATGVQHLPGR